jgi:(4-(4-[2-(gamma-L-glutamylamino)ethyl]phenoxymethyl)furan-2-yl)methanamine synthase
MTRTTAICDGTERVSTPSDVTARGARAAVVGWDVGGVNTKVARLIVPDDTAAHPVSLATSRVLTAARPFEIQREPEALGDVLLSLAAAVGVARSDTHAVTMTAELSQMFRRKRDGVAFVLDAIARAFPDADVGVYTTGGAFLLPEAARERPIAVAGANWAATARAVAGSVRTAVVVDIGTTTTDVVAVVDGVVRAVGWTDPDRLRSGELLYLGAVRTPVEAITHEVPVPGGNAGVSAEAFALAADVYHWRGQLAASAYTTPTPDGRPVTREAAGERLARVVCGDRELLDASAIDGIADAIAAHQSGRTAAAIGRVCARHPMIDTAIVMGIGDFIAADAARRAGLRVRRLADDWGLDAARVAPAAAVALLRAQEVGSWKT